MDIRAVPSAEKLVYSAPNQTPRRSTMYAHPELERDSINRKGVLDGGPERNKALAALIDSTVLKPDTTTQAIHALCAEAVAEGFRAVCVPPCRTRLARSLMDQAGPDAPRVCTVVGFPLGYATTAAKAAETRDAIGMGADEIDFVQNAGWVREGQWDALELEYRMLSAAAEGRLVKVILETSLLSASEIKDTARRAVLNGVHVVKTATGFGARGASADDIRVMAAALDEVEQETGARGGLKASGGIRTTADALEMVRLGATRIGTSSGKAIVDGIG
jgi:deoxyribose-phosphate aldolase